MRSSLSLATGLDRAFSILAKRDLLIEDWRYSLWQKSRRWERHKISVVLALHDEGATTPMRLTATDISASGCYVETIFPLSSEPVSRSTCGLRRRTSRLAPLCAPAIRDLAWESNSSV